MVRIQGFHSCGPGSIPCRGTEIPQPLDMARINNGFVGLLYSGTNPLSVTCIADN